MELRMADVLLASLAIARGAPPAPVVGNRDWQRQLAFAHEQLCAAAPQPAGLFSLPVQERDRAGELESCGMPQAGGMAPVTARAAGPVAATPASDTASPEMPLQRADADRVPVRVHVDAPAAQGMTVWLGLDHAQAPAGERAARVVADLLHVLHATPERVAAVVCNGVTVYPAAAPVGTRPQRATSPFPHASVKDLP
jgi:hypothetical protein